MKVHLRAGLGLPISGAGPANCASVAERAECGDARPTTGESGTTSAELWSASDAVAAITKDVEVGNFILPRPESADTVR